MIDKASANDPKIYAEMRQAKLIYLLGGFTHYLGQTLMGSAAWLSALQAREDGAVIAGSSAGAMVLCQYYYDHASGKVENGLNLVQNALVIPHHDRFGKGWAPRLQAKFPKLTLLGIDERTGMLNEGGAEWLVSGRGSVTVYRKGQHEIFTPGKIFSI